MEGALAKLSSSCTRRLTPSAPRREGAGVAGEAAPAAGDATAAPLPARAPGLCGVVVLPPPVAAAALACCVAAPALPPARPPGSCLRSQYLTRQSPAPATQEPKDQVDVSVRAAEAGSGEISCGWPGRSPPLTSRLPALPGRKASAVTLAQAGAASLPTLTPRPTDAPPAPPPAPAPPLLPPGVRPAERGRLPPPVLAAGVACCGPGACAACPRNNDEKPHTCMASISAVSAAATSERPTTLRSLFLRPNCGWDARQCAGRAACA